MNKSHKIDKLFLNVRHFVLYKICKIQGFSEAKFSAFYGLIWRKGKIQRNAYFLQGLESLTDSFKPIYVYS